VVVVVVAMKILAHLKLVHQVALAVVALLLMQAHPLVGQGLLDKVLLAVLVGILAVLRHFLAVVVEVLEV
jgi:hypothetical protein